MDDAIGLFDEDLRSGEPIPAARDRDGAKRVPSGGALRLSGQSPRPSSRRGFSNLWARLMAGVCWILDVETAC